MAWNSEIRGRDSLCIKNPPEVEDLFGESIQGHRVQVGMGTGLSSSHSRAL